MNVGSNPPSNPFYLTHPIVQLLFNTNNLFLDANINLEQGDLKEVTESTEVTTEETHDFTFSRVATLVALSC